MIFLAGFAIWFVAALFISAAERAMDAEFHRDGKRPYAIWMCVAAPFALLGLGMMVYSLGSVAVRWLP